MYIDCCGSSLETAEALAKLWFMLGEAGRCLENFSEGYRRGQEGVGEARRSQDESGRSPRDLGNFERRREAQERPRRRLREVIDLR